MNRSLVFASIGALATALLVAMLLSALMGGGEKKEEPVIEILLAKKDIPIGATLDTSNTHWQKWPNAESIPGVLLRTDIKDEDWKDQKIRRAISKDEPITMGALVKEIKGSYLAAALEPGMRAVTIDVSAASGVGGFLAPNDRVDVILTYNIRISSGSGDNALQDLFVEKAAETIVENSRILATDQDATGNTGSERQAKVNKTITLEVTPHDAEKITLAAQLGELSLTLRQLGDNETGVTRDKIVTDVQVSRILKKAVTLRKESEGSANSVRIYGPDGSQRVPVMGAAREGSAP